MRFTYTLLFAALIISGCSKESSLSVDDDSQNVGQYQRVNNWIRDNMEFYYFWNDRVPDTAPGDSLPEQFYNSILDGSDSFSRIYTDAVTYLEGLEGSGLTSGFSPAFGLFTGTENVFIIVEFVYPNSPAAEAGLQRGDLILGINGIELTTTNYLDLFYSDLTSANYQLGIYDSESKSISDGSTITISKEELSLDPIIESKVFNIENDKVGYIFYARFINGKNDEFKQSMNNAFQALLDSNITDLIIDLRYNPGGLVSAAQNLAGMIVPIPNAQAEDVFIRYTYNPDLQNLYVQREGENSDNLVIRFKRTPEVTLGLERVYFLATGNSASASELVITGLEPYMDVYAVGENTFGKFYGSFVITGLSLSPAINYAITPVTFKYANAAGFTDFRDGLTPDFFAEENLLEPYPIGDADDPLISTALEHILTGSVSAKAKQAIHYALLPDPFKTGSGSIMGIVDQK